MAPGIEAILTLDNYISLRPYSDDIEESITEVANDRSLWINMSHRFPHPYTLESARGWAKITQDREKWIPTISEDQAHDETDESFQARRDASRKPFCYAIWIDDKAVGTIGLEYAANRDCPHTVELGYWIGAPYRGKGYMTRIAGAFTQWTFDTFPWILRIEACAFGWNPGSQKVLRKVGFDYEGTEKLKYRKDGKLVDKVNFGLLRPGIDADAP